MSRQCRWFDSEQEIPLIDGTLTPAWDSDDDDYDGGGNGFYGDDDGHDSDREIPQIDGIFTTAYEDNDHDNEVEYYNLLIHMTMTGRKKQIGRIW